MKTCIYLVAWLLCYSTTSLIAKQSGNQLDYFEQYKDVAIREMLQTGIPASIMLSQGFLVSGAGKNELVQKANNHFGMPCGKSWTGQTHSKLTYNQKGKLETGCFRVYADAATAFRDFTQQITAPEREGAYRMLFKLATTDYYGWANGLELAGFALGKVYAEKLIRVIEDYGLYRYDAIFYMKGRLPKRYWSVDPGTDVARGESAGFHNYSPATDHKYPANLPYGFQQKKEQPGGYGDELARAPASPPAKNPSPLIINDYGGQLVVDDEAAGQIRGRRRSFAYDPAFQADLGFDEDQFAEKRSGAEVMLASYSVGSDKIYPSLPKTSLVRELYHKVSKSETLGRIARQYRITVKRLIHLNKLENTPIQPGMILRVN